MISTNPAAWSLLDDFSGEHDVGDQNDRDESDRIRVAMFRRDLFRDLLSDDDLGSALECWLKRLGMIFNWDAAGIWSRSVDSKTCTLQARLGEDSRFDDLRITNDSTFGDWQHSKTPLIVDRFPARDDFSAQQDRIAIVPLRRAQRCIGFLIFTGYVARSSNDATFLERLADDLAEGLEYLERREWIRERARLSQSLFHAPGSPVILLDREQRVTQWNPRAATLFGRLAAEVRGRPIPMFDDQATKRLEEIARMALAGRTTTESLRAVDADGRPLDLILSAAPLLGSQEEIVGVVLTGVDWTIPCLMEQNLKLILETGRIVDRSEGLDDAATAVAQRLTESFDWSICEIWCLDESETCWKRAGCWTVDEIGFESREEADISSLAIGDGIAGRVRVARRPIYPTRLTDHDRFPKFTSQLGLHDAIGIPIFVEGHVAAVLVGFARSIPEMDYALESILVAIAEQLGRLLAHERTTHALRHAEERLRHTEKMDSIGLVAGSVAHDFNNLLTVILGHSGIARDVLEAGDECDIDDLRDLIEQVDEAGQRAASLTRQLLGYSRKRKACPGVLDGNQSVNDMRQMLTRLIGNDFELELALAENLHPVKIDPSQLEQVLLNLVVNARDATPRGGHIVIRTRNKTLRAHQAKRHPEAHSGDYAVLEVSDEGCGMDAATQRTIFEPFFTTKAPGKGTGMGLAAVHAIVSRSGGFIEVNSTPDIGTTFSVHLPRSHDALATMRIDAPLNNLPGGSETILVAEDDDVVRNLIQRILESRGYTVLVAADGFEATRLFEREGARIALLVVDAVMPGTNGPRFVESARMLMPEVPVLYVTGYVDDDLRNPSCSGIRQAVLPKPFRADALVRTVRELLDGAPPEADA